MFQVITKELKIITKNFLIFNDVEILYPYFTFMKFEQKIFYEHGMANIYSYF